MGYNFIMLANEHRLTQVVEKDLRKKLKAFRGTMSNLGEVEVDHDKETIQEMQAKLFALQQSHESTMNWANMDRCQADIWSHQLYRCPKVRCTHVITLG